MDELTPRIEEGAYKPHDRLPTEQELVRHCGVSRVTVHHALRLLQDRGVVMRRPAKGTLVARPIVKRNLAVLGGFHDALVAQEIHPTIRLLDYRSARCPAHAFTKLRQGTAILLVRQHWVGTTPLAVATAYLHPVRALGVRPRTPVPILDCTTFSPSGEPLEHRVLSTLRCSRI